jgi:hypothetical protein
LPLFDECRFGMPGGNGYFTGRFAFFDAGHVSCSPCLNFVDSITFKLWRPFKNLDCNSGLPIDGARVYLSVYGMEIKKGHRLRWPFELLRRKTVNGAGRTGPGQKPEGLSALL